MSASQRNAAQQAAEILAPLLGVEQGTLRLPDRHPDAIAVRGGLMFAVQRIRSGAAGPVALAADTVRNRARELGKKVVPLLVSPFMSKAGRERCEAIGVAWLDLSGNARIFAPGIRISVLGQPNRFKQRGRPASVFAPQSARLARWLLMRGDRAWSQRELAQATHVDEGFVSRIVGKLEQEGLIVRNVDGKLRARDSNLLLDAWREQYRFDKHEIIRGHVPARSGNALLHELGKVLGSDGIDYAATGLGAAWLLTGFTGFRLVSIYLKDPPTAGLFERLSFREETKGANVWLIVPNDAGVFQGSTVVDGITCAHPVQVFLDLNAHPERSSEAAAELRKRLLRWESNG